MAEFARQPLSRVRKLTRQSKPYCPDHLHLLPYANKVMKRVEELEKERTALKEVGLSAFDYQGAIMEDINIFFSNTLMSDVKSIAGRIGLDTRMTYSLLMKLSDEGVLRHLETTRPGSMGTFTLGENV